MDENKKEDSQAHLSTEHHEDVVTNQMMEQIKEKYKSVIIVADHDELATRQIAEILKHHDIPFKLMLAGEVMTLGGVPPSDPQHIAEMIKGSLDKMIVTINECDFEEDKGQPWYKKHFGKGGKPPRY